MSYIEGGKFLREEKKSLNFIRDEGNDPKVDLKREIFPDKSPGSIISVHSNVEESGALGDKLNQIPGEARTNTNPIPNSLGELGNWKRRNIIRGK